MANPAHWSENSRFLAKQSGAVILFPLLAVLLVSPGCSIKRMAVNRVGDALAAGGTTFSSDDDPDLVKAATPFSLKMMESLLAESPRHEGLLLATASGFTQFAYAFVQPEADMLKDTDLAAATQLEARARRLYVRARNYGLRGLEVRHPGFELAIRSNPRAAVQAATVRDVPLLYWTAASWGAAISLAKDKPDFIAELPSVEALIDRALALDERFGDGAIHSFLITFEMSRAGGTGDPVARSRRHFERALELTKGQAASPLVSFAESVCVQKQNYKEFEALLQRALAIDTDARPEWRLENLVMQRRAQWLLGQSDDLFLNKEAPAKSE